MRTADNVISFGVNKDSIYLIYLQPVSRGTFMPKLRCCSNRSSRLVVVYFFRSSIICQQDIIAYNVRPRVEAHMKLILANTVHK